MALRFTLKPFEQFEFRGKQVPKCMRDGLLRYLEERIEPGQCLRAILENNLHEAFSRADDEVMENMHAIVAYLYNEAPSPSWGSPAKVTAWLEGAS